MEWRELPPGRELDKLVDESLGHKTAMDTYGNLCRCDPNESPDDWTLVPEHSTNDTQAMALLGKHWAWSASFYHAPELNTPKNDFRVAVDGWDNMYLAGRAATFAHAVCIAHLAVYEHMTERESRKG